MKMEHLELKCTNPPCISCSMDEPDASIRRFRIADCLKQLHLRNDEELLITLIGLWNIALAQPDDPQLPALGVFGYMAGLIGKYCAKERNWLFQGKNVYVPYYAAHIIGSYAMNKAQHAERAVKSGVIWPLMELMRGKVSWVEQRVAVRAVGHLASHVTTFEAISVHEEEIIDLAMKIASTCIDTVHTEFVCLESEKRLEYQRELMTGGRGGLEAENKKAEEWASQLRCWSLYLLNCFATKKRCIDLICKQEFLKDLCGMWGGVENQSSFAGVGLIRSLCQSAHGRKVLASMEEAVLSLCHFSRSSDNWQLPAIDSIVLLLKDTNTRRKVMDIAVPFLVDLVELESRSDGGRIIKVGDMITQVLLLDYSKIKYGELVLEIEKSQKALEEVWNLKVERKKNEKIMSEEEVRQQKLVVKMLKREGNQKFWSGDVEEAVLKYTKALDLCPVKLTKERIVLYSNRAQCYLVLEEPESAISDTTRALSLSASSVNPHVKSLWRRSQAYDMKGQARESLMDCIMYINERLRLKDHKRHVKIPYYAMSMLNKQITATWLFKAAAAESKADSDEVKLPEVEDHVDSASRKVDELSPRTPAGEKEPKLSKGCMWGKHLQRMSKRRKNCFAEPSRLA